MLVAEFQTVRPTMGDTRTYEDFYKFLGTRPARLGVVARLYPELTASYLTDALKNIYYRDSKSNDRYKSINALMFEWEVEVNYIKRIEFAEVPEGDGSNGSEITMVFKERYYEKYDIFKVDKTEQQFQVLYHPVRRADNYWSVIVRLIDPGFESTIDLSGCQIGDTTRFIGNAMPEMSEEGYTKYQSNIEKHRNYITTHRNDDSYSSLYAAQQDVFIKIGKGEGTGELKETLYKMDKVEANLLKNFLYGRNNMQLFAKTNVDKNGKASIVDPDTGRPIYIGDGIIPQVERFASKYFYNKLTVNAFVSALNMLREKAEKPTGNVWTVVCNEKFWDDVQLELADWLSKWRPTAAVMWSKAANGYLKVGNTFTAYEMGGNILQFQVDRTFSREYGSDKGYGLFLDLTADKVSGTPAIQAFTLKNGDFISNKFIGVGGVSGLDSGFVSSAVAASKLIIHGYSGIGVFAPYRSFIMKEV